MPHLIIDHSAGLEHTHDFPALFRALFDALAAHPATADTASLKIRARPHDAYLIGTDPQTFAHADLRLLPGRDDRTKTELGAVVLNTLQSALTDIGSLSVEISEMHGPSYAKRVL